MDIYQNVNNHIITFLKKNTDTNTLKKWKLKQNEFKIVLETCTLPPRDRDITTYQEVMEWWDGEYIFTDIFWENSMLMSKSCIDIEPPLQAKRLDEHPDNTIVLYKNMFSA
jgi:hypothetical protein